MEMFIKGEHRTFIISVFLGILFVAKVVIIHKKMLKSLQSSLHRFSQI